MKREFPVRLDNFVARMAIFAILLGVTILSVLNWKVVGWIIVGFGVETLVFAYLLGNAPSWNNGEWDSEDD